MPFNNLDGIIETGFMLCLIWELNSSNTLYMCPYISDNNPFLYSPSDLFLGIRCSNINLDKSSGKNLEFCNINKFTNEYTTVPFDSGHSSVDLH